MTGTIFGMVSFGRRQFLKMDPRGIGELIAKLGPALVLYARQWSAAPEDVVQDAFLKLAGQRTPPERVAAWLHRVVRNEAINRGRAEARRKKHETRAAARQPTWFLPESDLDARAATAALEGLPGEEREIIVMHLWGGLSFAEIAEVAGSTSSTVHRRYTAGIERLRERMNAPCPKTS